MAVTQRERVLPVPQQQLWDVLEDPHHMPRWWPGIERMEGVEADRFTQVFLTRRGRAVRLDFRVVASEPPWRRAWEQEVVGTPFERVLGESAIEVLLDPVQDGTRVTIAQRQQLRGYSRTGRFLLSRATRRRLDEALDGLERILAT